jgi:hypothetical protein
MSEAVGAVTGFLKRPIFTVNGMSLTVGFALVIAVVVYIAFFRK